MGKKEYTAKEPYKLFVKADEADVKRAEVQHWLNFCGGVAVWHAAALEMAGRTCLTAAKSSYWKHKATGRYADEPPVGDLVEDWTYIVGMDTLRPGWQWDAEPTVITDAACIQVLSLAESDVITRRYMDLALFTAACDAAQVKLTIEVRGRLQWHEISVALYLEGMTQSGNPPDGVLRAVLYHEREAYNEHDYRIGTECMRCLLSVEPAGSDRPTPYKATGLLSQLLVRVDEGAILDVELVSHPPEPDVQPAWRHVVTGEVRQGLTLTLPCDEDSDPWEGGQTVDGEWMSTEDFEDASLYSKPDSEFIHQEMTAALRRVLAVGAHRVLNPDQGCSVEDLWPIEDAHGKRI